MPSKYFHLLFALFLMSGFIFLAIKMARKYHPLLTSTHEKIQDLETDALFYTESPKILEMFYLLKLENSKQPK